MTAIDSINPSIDHCLRYICQDIYFCPMYLTGNLWPVLLFPDACPIFYHYLSSCDHLFPAASPLWLTYKGCVPTCSFFMSCLHHLLPKSYAGASMCAGGTTYLASLGTPQDHLSPQQMASEAWEVYIRVHPTLLNFCIFC